MFDDQQSVSRVSRPSWIKVAVGGCAALVLIGGIVVTLLYTAAIFGDSRATAPKPKPIATASARPVVAPLPTGKR